MRWRVRGNSGACPSVELQSVGGKSKELHGCQELGLGSACCLFGRGPGRTVTLLDGSEYRSFTLVPVKSTGVEALLDFLDANASLARCFRFSITFHRCASRSCEAACCSSGVSIEVIVCVTYSFNTTALF